MELKWLKPITGIIRKMVSGAFGTKVESYGTKCFTATAKKQVFGAFGTKTENLPAKGIIVRARSPFEFLWI
jgi:hypothetical protein